MKPMNCGNQSAQISVTRVNGDLIEVDRPNRQERSRHGKSDPVDAVQAARAALSGRATGLAKTKDGPVEAIRALLVARRSARNHRISALVQMRHHRRPPRKGNRSRHSRTDSQGSTWLRSMTSPLLVL